MPIDNSSRFPKPLAADLLELSEGMAIVIDGDTAPKAITAGQYLFIKNHSTLATGGYHATAAIASGADITSSNAAADADGIVNGAVSKLNGNLATLTTTVNGKQNALSVENFSSNVSVVQSGTSVNDVLLKKYGKVVSFAVTLTNTTSSAKTINGYTPYIRFPSSLRPSTNLNVLGRVSDGSVKYCYIPYYESSGYAILQSADSVTIPASGNIRFSVSWIID